MSRFARGVSGVGLSLAVFVFVAVGPAHADGGTFQQCLNQAFNHDGQPPVCMRVNGKWVPSWADDPGASGGIPGAFVLLVVVGILISIGVGVWKVSTARSLARQSGMDPGLATQMTLLSDDGLDATYLAASLRRPPVSSIPDPPGAVSAEIHGSTPTSAAERLTELKSLLDQGLVTSTEYEQRRNAIIDAV